LSEVAGIVIDQSAMVAGDPQFFLVAVASPGFVARRGRAGDYVMGHSGQTSGPGAAAARSLIVL